MAGFRAVAQRSRRPAKHNGAVRVSSRLDIEELGDLFGVEIKDEDVETVGGLMAKYLGKVPIPGAEVICEGLHFQAESLAGRRNKIVSVVVSPVTPALEDSDHTVPGGATAAESNVLG